MPTTAAYAGWTGGQDRNTDRIVIDAMLPPEGLIYDQYYTIDPSFSREQYKVRKYSGLASVPRVGEGAPIPLDNSIEVGNLTTALVNYALGFTATHEMRRSDDEFGLLPTFAQGLGRSFYDTTRTVHANVVNRATSGSYTYLDSKALAVNDHPTAGSTQSNVLTVAANLTATQLQNMVVQALKLLNYRGLNAGFVPDKLLVPPDLTHTADVAIGTPFKPGSMDNDINPIAGTFTKIVDRFLTDTNGWSLISSGHQTLVSKTREAAQVHNKAHPTAHNAWIWYVYASFLVTVDDWVGFFHTPGA